MDNPMIPKSIMLFEDDLNLRQSIALILQRVGYTVSATDCVDKALQMLRGEDYQLLISDTNLPETNSELLPKVLQVFPNLPIVILTDQTHAEAERQSRQFCAFFLVKPVAPEKLLDYVDWILRSKNNSVHAPIQGSSEDNH
jgi:two-component system nitrogen regulation response regulator NtrX